MPQVGGGAPADSARREHRYRPTGADGDGQVNVEAAYARYLAGNKDAAPREAGSAAGSAPVWVVWVWLSLRPWTA